jgi:hypothetical protein
MLQTGATFGAAIDGTAALNTVFLESVDRLVGS